LGAARPLRRMKLFVQAVTALSRFCGVMAAAMIAISVGVVCHMIVVRSILGQTVIWQTEFITFALVAATFIGSPYVLLTRGHVNVDLIPLYLGRRARFALALVGSLLALGFCVLVLVNGIGWWWEAVEGGWVNDTLWAPKLWVPYFALPFGFGVLALQYVADIVSLVTGQAPPFGMKPKP
jgi:TRAP-type C4-dicarboxylate transport system permease small subunit